MLKKEINKKTNKKIITNAYIQFSLIFMMVSIFFFLYFIIYKKTFLWSNDGVCVNYIKLIDLRQMLKQLLLGNGPTFWSWNIGLGSDVIGNYNSMGMFDPINILAALVPVSYMDVAYSISVYAHIYLAGIAFLAYSKEFHVQKFSAVVGAICYSFSGWMILSGLTQDFFLIGPVLFPIILLGFERIIKNRGPLIFIITVAVILINSPYHAFMAAFIMCIYAPLRIFRLDDCIKNKLKICFKLFIYVLSGVLISAIILLPTFNTLINSTNDTFNTSDGIAYNIGKYYMNIPAALLSFTESGGKLAKFQYSMIGVSVIVILMVISLTLKRKKNKELFIMLSICGVCYLIPILGSAFNAFRYPSNRWGFIFVFFLCLTVSYCLNINEPLLQKESKIMKRILTGLFVWTLFVGKVCFDLISDTACVGVGVAVIIGIMIVGILSERFSETDNKKLLIKKSKVLGLVCLNIIIAGNLYFSPSGENFIKSELDIGEMQERLADSTQSVTTKINDNSLFYRIDQIEGMKNNLKPKSVSNENVYFKFKSLNSFMPTKDRNWDDFNRELLITSNLRFRPSAVSNDNRARLNTLMGVKYFLGTNSSKNSRYNDKHIKNASQYAGYGFENYKKINNVQILKNKYDLGVGFVYNSYMSEHDFKQLDYPDREQALFQTSVVEGKNLSNVRKIKKEDLNLNKKELLYTTNTKISSLSNQKSFAIYEEDDNLKLNISSLKQADNCELYLYFENLQRKPPSFRKIKHINYADKPLTRLEKIELETEELFSEKSHNFKITANYGGITKRAYNSSDELQGIDMNDFLINLGYCNTVDGTIELSFDQYGKYSFDKMKIYAVSMDNYDSQAQKLVNNKFLPEKVQNNLISGYTNSAEAGVLYLSIVNNEGWSATVDGKPADILKTNIGFTGVFVDSGKHYITLKYLPKGFKAGVVLSIAGILITLSSCITRKRKCKKS